MGKRGFLFACLALLAVAMPTDLVAQDRRIAGRVVQAGSGQPIVAAEVTLAGSGRAPVLTTDDGSFVITVPAGDVRIQVRAFGFSRADVPVPANESSIIVQLSEDVFKLDELVVTGQATNIERRSATTAIAYVSGSDIDKVPAPTVLNSLNGRITGVNLQTNSGAPGGGIQMQIRGNATILGGYDPLFVVDGVLYSNATIPSGRGFANAAASVSTESDAVNRIADLNPDDIASIEVLKGAAASSIYGSKASNGVVVITTKRGQAGAPQINVTQRIGVYSPLKLYDTRVWTQDSAVASFGQAALPYFQGNSAPYHDAYSQVYDNRKPSYETIADVRGGSETTRYFVSGNWKHDEGIERSTFATRQGLRANIDQTFSSRFQMQLSSAYARNTNDRGWNNNCNNYGCHGYAIAYIPSFVNLAQKNPDGSYPKPTLGVQSNPLQLTELGVNDEETNRFTGGVTLNWAAYESGTSNLRIVGGGGLDTFNQENNVWTPNELFFEAPQSLPGESIESGGRSLFWNWNVNAIHTWNAASFTASTSAGIQYEDRRLNTFRIRTQNLLPGQQNVNQGTNTTATENLTQERTIALYAQEGLRLFEERLLIQAGLRAERSSVNGDIDKYYVFPKASASYRFLDLLGDGSELKARFAYGETGNQPLFGQKFTNLGTPQLGGQQGVTVGTTSGAPDVEPERLKEIEGGLDGFMLDGRLTWELTGFRRNTTNLLLQRVPAPSSGYTTQIFNGGEIRNQGIEAAVGVTPLQTDNTTWITRATFTRYTSEVVDLAGLPPFFPAQSGFGNLGRTRIEEGKPITQIIGFNWNEEHTGRASSLSQLGNSAPDFRVGLVNDFTYKSLNLLAVLDWSQGGDIINLQQFLLDDGRTSEDWGSAEWAERYQGYLTGVIAPYIEDATFLKVREISATLAVPTRYIPGNIGIENMRIGLTASNPFMWTKYSGLDPEVANFGSAAIRNNLDIAAYPPSRGIFFTLSAGF